MKHPLHLIRRFAVPAAYLVIGVLLIIWPALYNGYPLVYSDTGSYLQTSVTMEAAMDRPIGYGIFMRIVGWQATTWPVVFAQGLIIYWITLRVVKLLFERYRPVHIAMLGLLSLLSSLPWYAGQLMPDIFAGVLLLTVYLFFYDAGNWKRRLLYGITIAFMTLFHYSFFVMTVLAGTLLLLFHLRHLFTRNRKYLYAWLLLLVCMATSVLTIMTVHYNQKGKFRFSFSSNVFLTAKFCDGNILYTYLQDNCGRKDVPYCEYKDTLPNSPSMFLWDDRRSPFLHEGFHWEESNERCAIIVHDVFTTPKYQWLFLQEAWRSTTKQLRKNKIGSGLIAYGATGSPGDILASDYEGEIGQYLGSRQNSGKENFEELTINDYNQTVLKISTLLILAGLCYRPVRRKCWKLLVFCLLGIVFNAFVTAALANVYDRLQARITWLLIFAALVAVGIAVQELREKRKALKPVGSDVQS